MSGGSNERVAGYRENLISTRLESSGFASEPTTLYDSKYFDVYDESANTSRNYSTRKLGDATGEMGPFDYINFEISSWYGDMAEFVQDIFPWFVRGGNYSDTTYAGMFYFNTNNGGGMVNISTRLVLSPSK